MRHKRTPSKTESRQLVPVWGAAQSSSSWPGGGGAESSGGLTGSLAPPAPPFWTTGLWNCESPCVPPRGLWPFIRAALENQCDCVLHCVP